jgi:hypothetical protein
MEVESQREVRNAPLAVYVYPQLLVDTVLLATKQELHLRSRHMNHCAKLSQPVLGVD